MKRYRLKKDLPGIPAGTFIVEEENWYCFEGQAPGLLCWNKHTVEHAADWFELVEDIEADE